MDAQPNPEYDPLKVPVADATPEELEIQARHHATNAAFAALDTLLQSPEDMDKLLDCFGESVVTVRENLTGESTLDALRIVQLSNLLDNTQVVFYRVVEADQSVTNGFGIIEDDLSKLHVYPAGMLALVTNVDVIRTTARMLSDLQLRAGLYAAFKGIHASLTSKDVDTLKHG